jgi:hypothetical protein
VTGLVDPGEAPVGRDPVGAVVRVGPPPPLRSRGDLRMRLFHGSELEEVLARQPCRILDTLPGGEPELAAEHGAANAASDLLTVPERT